MRTPNVGIVIINWNGATVLETCLASLARTRYPSFNATVVDNGSTDTSCVMARSKFPQVRLIENKENLGYTRANNQAIRLFLRSGADYVLLLNNDTEIVEEDWLMKIVEFAEADGQIGIVGPRVIFPDGSDQVSAFTISPLGVIGYASSFSEKRPAEVDSILGAVLLIKRAVIDKVGLLDEEYSPFLCEETDFCLRAKRAGFKVMYFPEVRVSHMMSASMSRVGETTRLYVGFRNIARFRLIHYPLLWVGPSMFSLLMGAFVRRTDTSLRLSKLKLESSFPLRLSLVALALVHNLRCLDGIVRCRLKNRALQRPKRRHVA
jgi:hypothetical protein